MKINFLFIKKFLSVNQSGASHSERLISALGGFISIFLIIYISQSVLELKDSAIIIASMGASAVLLFAVPHGPLSQPWALIAGHLISAIVGVSCVKIFGVNIISASIAVGVAIGLMYYMRCLHPPGGATALSAVLGGESINALAYQYVLTPVLINILVIILIAIIFNFIFTWRRYPLCFQNRVKLDEGDGSSEHDNSISHGDFVYALSKIDSFIDVSEEDLLRIYSLATENANKRYFPLDGIRLGKFYSNGEYGDKWCVRQVVDESQDADPEKYQIIYKVIAGEKRRSSSCNSLLDFARWAKYQVELDEENWKRVDR